MNASIQSDLYRINDLRCFKASQVEVKKQQLIFVTETNCRLLALPTKVPVMFHLNDEHCQPLAASALFYSAFYSAFVYWKDRLIPCQLSCKGQYAAESYRAKYSVTAKYLYITFPNIHSLTLHQRHPHRQHQSQFQKFFLLRSRYRLQIHRH